MLDAVFEHMQRDATEKSKRTAKTVRYYHRAALAQHIIRLFASIFCYACLLISLLLGDEFPNFSTRIISIAALFVATILILISSFTRQQQFLNRVIQFSHKILSKISQSKQKDLFYAQFWATIALIYLPLCGMAIIASVPTSPWIDTSSPSFLSISDPLKQIMTFTAGLIAAQIALFTFMFSQLLGKYSSKIAGTLYKHPVVLMLWAYPISALSILYLFYIYGYPDFVKLIIIPFFAALNIFCLTLTIWVANAGMQTDKAITYAGIAFSKRVRKFLKPALQLKTKFNLLWKTLNILGLDWRDSARMILFTPPNKGVNVTTSFLASLFNAVNKSVQEGQHEVFASSLNAILNVMVAYTERRSTYYGTSDQVNTYVNTQVAALMSVASKSPNEYLITDLVKCIGNLGVLSLQIETLPKEEELTIEKRTRPKNHPIANSWMWLLRESFDVSHNLMRSTAANEAINQLQRVALAAYYKEYGDLISVGFTSNIKQIHHACLLKPDAYHLTLAGDCIRKTLELWCHTALKHGQCCSMHDINEEIAQSIESMTKSQFIIEKLPSFNFSDATNVLTSKLEKMDFIIQDIFVLTLFRIFQEPWEQRATIKDLKRIIKLLRNIARSALENNIAGCSNYIEAFYEICYFILRGLPEQYKLIKNSAQEDHGLFNREEPPNQDIMEKEIFKVWSELFPLFHKNDQHIGLDWKQNFFGIIGLGIGVYRERPSVTLKAHLISIVQQYFQICMEENAKPDRGISKEAWDYLQLLGSWTLYFLKDINFAKTIAKTIGRDRPFSASRGGSSRSHYGIYGYPSCSLGSDFFLPWLRNLQPQEYLKQKDWEKFKALQEQVMNPKVLMPYYKLVEETRGPLRKAFYEEIRKRNDPNS